LQNEAILRLGGVQLTIREGHAPNAGGAMRATPDFDLVLDVPAAQLTALRQRLEKEILQLEKNITNSERQLTDDTFTGRAPAHIVSGMRDKLGEYKTQLTKSREVLAGLP
jgi:valyl-tRNA synthetase